MDPFSAIRPLINRNLMMLGALELTAAEFVTEATCSADINLAKIG